MPAGFDNVPNVGEQLANNAVGGNVGGIFSTRPSAKYMSGARCVLRINSKPVAFAFAVSWRIDTSYLELNVIDNPLAEELIPKAIQVSGSISALHIPGQGAGAQLWQGDVLSFLFHQYITIEVRDSETERLLFFAPKAVITSRQEEIKTDDLAQMSLSFMAIGFKDEKEPEAPTGYNDVRRPGLSIPDSSLVPTP
jgi:hypothetical protein